MNQVSATAAPDCMPPLEAQRARSLGLGSVTVTGATGFIGRALVEQLSAAGHSVLPVVRRTSANRLPPTADTLVIDSLTPDEVWVDRLRGQDVVIHCAARVHMLDDPSTDPLAAFRLVNTASTLALARQAAAAGVRRFVFLSTVKVNGEHTTPGVPFTSSDVPQAQDPYGVSKLEAEQGLRLIAAETGMEVVILRPVLVYGPGVKANFRSMMNWLARGVPLPLGSVHNMRSFVSLANLIDLIECCIHHPAAANRTFMVSDGEDLSTTDLLRRLAAAMHRPARLVPVPVVCLEAAATLVGRRAVAQRLCGSLQVDIAETCTTLGWKPPLSVDAGLRLTAVDYLENR